MTEDLTRNKDATQQRILLAASQILSSHGFAALGVNTLAKAALCDKKLIYRYFEGIDGVIAVLGQDVAQRFVDALNHAVATAPQGWRAFQLALLDGLLAAYRQDPLLVRLRAAEIASPEGGFAPFAQARGTLLANWIAENRPMSEPPKGVDIPAFNAAMIGAVEAAVISAVNSDGFAGLALRTPQDWNRYHDTMRQIIMAQFLDEGTGR